MTDIGPEVMAFSSIGHLKIAGETDASHLMVLLAALFSLLAMIMALVYVSRQLGHILQILGGFVIVAVSAEILLQKIAKRKILPRIIEQK